MPKPGSEGEWKSPPCRACSNKCDGAMLEGWLKFGVPVREMGDCERSDSPEEILPDARRCWARASWPSASGCAAGRPPWSLVRLRPPGPPVLTRFRLLMTSVFRLMGRGRPCSFKKRPQALQRTAPDSSRRQRGVVEVAQFWQDGCRLSAGALQCCQNPSGSSLDDIAKECDASRSP